MAGKTSVFRSFLLLLLVQLSLIQPSAAQSSTVQNGYVQWTLNDGTLVWLRDNRQPALWTQSFGDCMGSNDVSVSRFDAAFYHDNMTVVFHIVGETELVHQSVEVFIEVWAYGESRFAFLFNPCSTSITSLCPLRKGIPIEAAGAIPVTDQEVSGVPNLAYSIPDFEGQAILRIFSNETHEQIACFAATVTNGSSFSQPDSVGTILGLFTIIAIAGSFVTAIHGSNLSVMRLHYKHSLSVFLVFAVLQSIYFSGALSMDWPSCLPAFWSNYAWAAGMIYTSSMQGSISNFIGPHVGNTTKVGADGSGYTTNGLGGGYNIAAIFPVETRRLARRFIGAAGGLLSKRAAAQSTIAGASQGYHWYGDLVAPGMPLPGTYSGFAGTLAAENIPLSNAFLTGLLWFMILLVIVAGSVMGFKGVLELLVKWRKVKPSRLTFFRFHWRRYTVMTLLRTLLIGFFTVTFLLLFQFAYDDVAGAVAIAAVFLVIFVGGVVGMAGYALWIGIKLGKFGFDPARVCVRKKRVWRFIPWFEFYREPGKIEGPQKGFVAFWSTRCIDSSGRSIFDEDEYMSKYAWLVGRFRESRWWFFAAWLVYELIKACFLAGTITMPMLQAGSVLGIEFIALVAVRVLKPFKEEKLNNFLLNFLCLAKVAVTAASIPLATRFDLGRILATVIGIIIIVIQGSLTVALIVVIAISASSTYVSCKSRDDELPANVMKPLRAYKARHSQHISSIFWKPPKDSDVSTSNSSPDPYAVAIPREPKDGFSIGSVRRLTKIEDEDGDIRSVLDSELGGYSTTQLGFSDSRSQIHLPGGPPGLNQYPRRWSAVNVNRPDSVHSNTSYPALSRAARTHRPSWTSRDFESFRESADFSSQRFGDYSHVSLPPAIPATARSMTLPSGLRMSQTWGVDEGEQSTLGATSLWRQSMDAAGASTDNIGDVAQGTGSKRNSLSSLRKKRSNSVELVNNGGGGGGGGFDDTFRPSLSRPVPYNFQEDDRAGAESPVIGMAREANRRSGRAHSGTGSRTSYRQSWNHGHSRPNSVTEGSIKLVPSSLRNSPEL